MTNFRKNYNLFVEAGDVEGQEIFIKFGRNNDMDTGSVPEDVFEGGGTYMGFPDVAETVEVFSSDPNDTAGGTGARLLQLDNLLDENKEQIEPITVALNGTTPVVIPAQLISRCSVARVLTAGSLDGNAGVITIRHTTTIANVFGIIPIGRNQTNILCYTVPAGKTLYASHININLSRASGAGGSATTGILIRGEGGVFLVAINPEITSESGYQYDGEYLAVPEKSDVKLRVFSVSDNNTIISGDVSGKLVDM